MFKSAPDILTVNQAAELLSVSKATVYNLVADGELECRRVGRLIRIRKADLIDFISRHN